MKITEKILEDAGYEYKDCNKDPNGVIDRSFTKNVELKYENGQYRKFCITAHHITCPMLDDKKAEFFNFSTSVCKCTTSHTPDFTINMSITDLSGEYYSLEEVEKVMLKVQTSMAPKRTEGKYYDTPAY
jgi:hypothetical protein